MRALRIVAGVLAALQLVALAFNIGYFCKNPSGAWLYNGCSIAACVAGIATLAILVAAPRQALRRAAPLAILAMALRTLPLFLLPNNMPPGAQVRLFIVNTLYNLLECMPWGFLLAGLRKPVRIFSGILAMLLFCDMGRIIGTLVSLIANHGVTLLPAFMMFMSPLLNLFTCVFYVILALFLTESPKSEIQRPEV